MKSKLRHPLDICLRLLRAGLMWCFDSLVLLAYRKKNQRQEGAIFCLHGLGDLLLAGHAIARLSSHLRSQGLRPILFVQPPWIEFARRQFQVDGVEGIDRHRFTRHFAYRACILRSVAGRFAVAVQPTFNRMLRVEDYLVRATGARQRIGSAGHAPFINALERRCGDRFYTKLIEPQPGLRHELERYSEFMAGMGMSVPTDPWRLEKNGSNDPALPNSPYLVLAPNASDARRSWPLENFLQAAKQIAMQNALTVVVIGDKNIHSPLGWLNGNGDNPVLVDLCKKIQIENLPAVLAHAKLIISNDSGIYHLGVSLNRPTIAVGGSGLPVRYFPYPRENALMTKVLFHSVPCAGCNWRCVYAPLRTETVWCLRQISWPELANAADELLRRSA